MLSAFDPQDYLEQLGSLPDAQIDLAKASIALASAGYPGRVLERYLHHFKILAEDITTRHAELLAAGGNDDVETRLAALKHIIADKAGYDGDHQDTNNLLNADMIAAIERLKGQAIILSILYIQSARAQGWQVDGLNIPGHFLVRLAKDGRLLIFDPFNRAALVQAPDIRAFVKQALGPQAEISSSYFEPVSNREILITLQNIVKSRQIEASDYEAALETIQCMRLIDPQEYRLLLDEGVLLSKTGRGHLAVHSLEAYISKAENPKDREDALRLLVHIRLTLDDHKNM